MGLGIATIIFVVATVTGVIRRAHTVIKTTYGTVAKSNTAKKKVPWERKAKAKVTSRLRATTVARKKNLITAVNTTRSLAATTRRATRRMI